MPKYQSKYKGNQIDNLLDFVNDNKDNLALKEEIPEIPSIPRNVSELSNDLGFITNTVNNLINYYKKTETYTKDEINTIVSASASGGFIKVNELPTENINIKAIYLVPYTGSRAKNLYEEYIYVDGDWEMIGTTKIDLSNYVTITALNTALADYLTSESFNTQIANYYNKTEIAGLLADKIDNNKIGAANGVASLDNNGKVPSSQLPEQQTGNVSNTGFTPIGTIIPLMGTTAPRHYLACNGQIINISDYPELADYFEEQFGTKNHFGGNGETTFAVPDLRGEFLRGSGTNSHTNQGSGANVGVHQDATNHIVIGSIGNGGNISTRNVTLSPGNVDGYNGGSGTDHFANMSNGNGTKNSFYTSRPTNTSVLYCIATKNIYVDARFDYSTQEKVVGTWIDGKPLYQKTITFTSQSSAGNKYIDISELNLSTLMIDNSHSFLKVSDTVYFPVNWGDTSNYLMCAPISETNNKSIQFRIITNGGWTLAFNKPVYVTIQYTKTTD